jgi:hypothetical protein
LIFLLRDCDVLGVKGSAWVPKDNFEDNEVMFKGKLLETMRKEGFNH